MTRTKKCNLENYYEGITLKPWSVEQAILKEVDIEDKARWSKTPHAELPPFKKEKVPKNYLFLFYKHSVELVRQFNL